MTTKKFTPIIKRGPRLTPGEINVTPPDDLGVEIPPSGIQKALPWVMGGGMLGMITPSLGIGIAGPVTDRNAKPVGSAH